MEVNIDPIIIQNEKIVETIFHKNHLPFRQEDWLRVILLTPILILGISLLVTEWFSFFGALATGISFYYYGGLISRWIKICNLKYYLTDRSLIIYNVKKKTVEHYFDFLDFPKMTLRENAYDYGFIILGEPKPIIVGDVPFKLFESRIGVSLSDHEVVLDNIPNVRKAYDLIQQKINKNELLQKY